MYIGGDKGREQSRDHLPYRSCNRGGGGHNRKCVAKVQDHMFPSVGEGPVLP